MDLILLHGLRFRASGVGVRADPAFQSESGEAMTGDFWCPREKSGL